jgi:predicted DNA-binding transcriptional regulator AlpA
MSAPHQSTDITDKLCTGNGEPPVAKARRRALVSTAHIKTSSGEPAPASTTDTDNDDYECFLTRKQVCTIIGVSYSVWWSMMCAGTAPLARKLSRNRVGWLRSEILSWMRSRPPQHYKPP